ncbi:glucokinase [Paramagnetospirillum marisnigri]|uniref:Glucokinase n=1 Tax=Paramagnetospirillum marisnigri TaxID=1285242 RepID=A0A178MME2_9PROT|nr:glucokinase [Paramagnetospirillum marisnigri]OAN49922.1 glucokinase [Paramagnetospirillum marisnigri]
MTSPSGLLADIGGTHIRFALVTGEIIEPLATLRCADFAGPVPAARAALGDLRPEWGAFAVAAVPEGDIMDVVNSGWRFSVEETRRALGLVRLEVVNDFTAVALSLPLLVAEQRLPMGGGTAVPQAPMAVLGPGTGLGVSSLVPVTGGGWVPLATEGGMVTLAAADEAEALILARLRREHGHVPAELLLSGSGLVVLYRVLAEMAGTAPDPLAPDQVAARAMAGQCRFCVKALDHFFALLGTVAAGLALSVGARGGVFLAGGILPRMAETLGRSRFRARFEDQGRFAPYLAAIPVWLITDPCPAFTGLRFLARAWAPANRDRA